MMMNNNNCMCQEVAPCLEAFMYRPCYILLIFFSCFVEKHFVAVNQTVEEMYYHQRTRETAVSIRMVFPTVIMELVDLV